MGRVSFRRNASNYCPVVSEVLEYAKHQVDKYYLDLIDELDLEEDDGEEEDDGDENCGSSNFDETRRDRIKSRLGLNVMEKTVKLMKKSGAWDDCNGEIDEDDRTDGMPVLRDLMLMDESGANAAPEIVDCDLESEVDRLLCIGDDLSPRPQLTPTTS